MSGPTGDRFGDLVQRTDVATRDFDTATAVISRAYGAHRFDLGHRDADFEFRSVGAEVGSVTSNVVHYGLRGRVEVAPTDSFTTIATRAEFANGST